MYTTQEAVLFKLKMTEDGKLNIRFYEQQLNNGESEIVLIESKQIQIGG